MFFNMKIEVNEDQPLDDVVKELERLGYRKDDTLNDCACYVFTLNDGFYFIYMDSPIWSVKSTTLSELKEMKCSN